MGKDDEAIRDLEHALELEQEDAETWAVLGSALMNKRDYARAATALAALTRDRRAAMMRSS